jgi:hypothetical protein
MKKEAGGLNVPNLRDLNMCLLGSWVRRYHKDEWSLWRKVVDAKYNTKNPKILCCNDGNPSQFWKAFLWAKQPVEFGYKWKIGNGKTARFWEDCWFGKMPLAILYWIYGILHCQ